MRARRLKDPHLTDLRRFAAGKAANALERRVEDMGDRIFRLRYQNRLE